MKEDKIIPNKQELLYILLFFIVNILITIFLFVLLSESPKENLTINTEEGVVTATLITLGFLTYTLGLRHAVDADHLAAIDNAARKLVQEGKRPFFVGTFFSLGHSTIVIIISLILILSVRVILENISNIETIGGIIGPTISATFLYIISFINLLIFYQLYKLYKHWKKVGKIDEVSMDEVLGKRGFYSRILRSLFKIVSRQWHMYLIGLLFGLGFDTATQIATYGIAIALTTTILPVQYIIIFPVLFTCGMTLLDTLDGIFMTSAYKWAFIKPISKLWYNITMTLISVIVGFIIGSIEYLSIASTELGLSGGFWDFINSIDFESVGFMIVATFGITWVTSWIIYKLRIEKILKK
ncbi:MAG: HoxN/HupN/NixA family nickel/cobalt transporter [Sulfolobaceae archaeon]